MLLNTEERMEIMGLVARYNFATDHGRAKEWAEVYVPRVTDQQAGPDLHQRNQAGVVQCH
jgi:hypothetical protein